MIAVGFFIKGQRVRTTLDLLTLDVKGRHHHSNEVMIALYRPLLDEVWLVGTTTGHVYEAMPYGDMDIIEMFKEWYNAPRFYTCIDKSNKLHKER